MSVWGRILPRGGKVKAGLGARLGCWRGSEEARVLEQVSKVGEGREVEEVAAGHLCPQRLLLSL